MKMNRKLNNQNGFTLVELLVAMGIAVILGGGVYATFDSQYKSYIVQERVAGMQQNLRAAMFIMEREIRMAACDPTPEDKDFDGVDNDCDSSVDEGDEKPGIKLAASDSIEFTMDLDSDGKIGNQGSCGDQNEHITYSLYDSGGDGDDDLGRKDGAGTRQPVAENIEVLNFVYLDEDENKLDDDGSGNVTASIDDIRTVMIALVARTARVDRDFVNGTAYQNLLGEQILAAQNDNFRRRLLTSRIQGRNLGLD